MVVLLADEYIGGLKDMKCTVHDLELKGSNHIKAERVVHNNFVVALLLNGDVAWQCNVTGWWMWLPWQSISFVCGVILIYLFIHISHHLALQM